VKETRKDTWEGRGHEALHIRSGMKRLISCSDYWREQEKISMRTYRRARVEKETTSLMMRRNLINLP
jgi:hypothetical protein